MKAFVLHGAGRPARDVVPDPAVKEPTGVVVRVDVFARAARTGDVEVVLGRGRYGAVAVGG
ncbi:hypothetical protein [Streptomyces griseorubiginosus]|uniref:hypothetical protein n=1 Tax=Streptomyces griseorubiginosus TaxID=67304 RepID=UPI00113FF2F0|nr:hypothetical protein [Streptomyces griseorubiginosus]